MTHGLLVFVPRIAAALALLALAACGSGYRPVANARFEPPDRILVLTRSAKPLQEATLVAPDGSGWSASQVDSDAPRRTARPDIGIGVEGGSASGVNPGISIGLPLFGWIGSAFRETPPVQGRAMIRVPDAARYRRDWPAWTIELLFGPPGSAESLTLMAPDPAAAP